MNIFDDLIGKDIILTNNQHYGMKCRFEGYNDFFIKVFVANKKGSGKTLVIPIKSIVEIEIA